VLKIVTLPFDEKMEEFEQEKLERVLRDVQIVKYQAELKEAEEKGLPEPKANRYIAQAILDMVKGMGQKFNYRDYTWLDEMQGAAIISCVKAIKKYDPSRSNNPFGFLDQCIAWAFHAVIKEENTQKSEDKPCLHQLKILGEILQIYLNLLAE